MVLADIGFWNAFFLLLIFIPLVTDLGVRHRRHLPARRHRRRGEGGLADRGGRTAVRRDADRTSWPASPGATKEERDAMAEIDRASTSTSLTAGHGDQLKALARTSTTPGSCPTTSSRRPRPG